MDVSSDATLLFFVTLLLKATTWQTHSLTQSLPPSFLGRSTTRFNIICDVEKSSKRISRICGQSMDYGYDYDGAWPIFNSGGQLRKALEPSFHVLIWVCVDTTSLSVRPSWCCSIVVVQTTDTTSFAGASSIAIWSTLNDHFVNLIHNHTHFNWNTLWHGHCVSLLLH